jgi:hypothetical protein
MTTTMTRPRGVGRKIAHDPGDPLVTSHCPFCGSGQVVGRSDGTIGCDFCGQAYIVRVQPAFPGMPQMPNGPGAPSDVGPDGMVDPGMIGPDGMPMDGGPPPEEGDPDGGGPPFAPGGDDDDAPSKGDGKEDDSGSGPPPKGKSKKKSSLAYRGVHGQPLTEEQLIRHIAVVASGRDPRVMARLRAAGRSRRTAGIGMTGPSSEWMPFMRGLSNASRAPLKRSPHNFAMGQHEPTGKWYMAVRPQAPEHRHLTHVVPLGHPENPVESAALALRQPEVADFMRATRPGSPRMASRRVAGFSPEELVPHRTLSSGHQVSIGRHGEDWYGIVSAPRPFERHTHMMYLGREDDPRAAADRHLSTPPVRSFLHATTPAESREDRYQEVQGASSGAWWNKPSQVRAPDPIFHSASARG